MIIDNDTVVISNERISPNEYIDFLKRSDLGKQYPKENFHKRIEILLKNVTISLLAKDKHGKTIGICFGLTDYAYWLKITDLGVDRAYSRKGIGRKLMQICHELSGGIDNITMVAFANHNAVPFYEKIGMVKSKNMMEYSKIKWTEFVVE